MRDDALPLITDEDEIKKIFRRTPTSSLIQTICGLRAASDSHSVESGKDYNIIAVTFDNETKSPVRVRLLGKPAMSAVLEEVNIRIPKRESWE